MPRARVQCIVPVLAAALIAACGGSDTAKYDGLYARTVRTSIGAIERSTGRRFLQAPKLQERTRDDLRAYLEQAFNEQMPALELAGIEGAYKRFGLLPGDFDMRGRMMQLLTEQVLGYYDPKAKVLFVMKDAPQELIGTTITHELVHALQDQYFPLDSLVRIKASNDRRTAAQSVAEGQGVWEQLVILSGVANPANVMPGGWDEVRRMIRENQGSMPVLNDAPTLLREVLLFPYLSGAEHIRQFKTRRPKGWPFDSLPQSTEQILHADKYFGAPDRPVTVSLPPLRGGAKPLYESDLGEFETRLFVYEHTQDQALAIKAAAGWGGDRFAFVSLPGGGDGLVWALAWDTPVDAAEFVDALEIALPRRYAGLKRRPGGGETRVYEGGGRVVAVRAVTVDGRSVVLLTDVPAGIAPELVDPARIRLSS